MSRGSAPRQATKTTDSVRNWVLHAYLAICDAGVPALSLITAPSGNKRTGMYVVRPKLVAAVFSTPSDVDMQRPTSEASLC